MEIKEFLLKDFKLDAETAKHGGEADVYEETHKEFPGQLAVKKWRQRQSFEGEIELLKQLSHENVIQIFGRLVDLNKKPIGYIMPYMPNGSLHDGESCNEVKLSDFGIARSTESSAQSMTTRCGTPVYMAPEILNSKKYNKSADIYSLSITIWEILCRRHPYEHVHNKLDLFNKIANGERPQLTNDLSYELSNFLKRCWDANTSRRPAIIEIVDFFTKETILLTGGLNERPLESLLFLVDNRNNWKQSDIKLPYAVYHHGAQFLNNSLYIFGGENTGKDVVNYTYKLRKSPEWYKLENFQWEKMANMNEKRSAISNSSVILNNQIWVCGGFNLYKNYLKSVEMYDPLTNKWKLMKDMNQRRKNAAAAVVNGKIFCSGGHQLNSVEYYDPSSDVWTRISNMPKQIWGHGAVEIDGKLIVMGGYDDRELVKNVWEWDAMDENAEWIDKPSMPIPRRWFSIAKIHDKIFICGGKFRFFEPTDLVEIFDGKVWRNGPKMPTYREQAAAVVIPMPFAKDLKEIDFSLSGCSVL